MDVASLASSILTAQAGNTQQQIATSVLKSNLDAERSSVLTILGSGSQPSLANVGAGVGGNVNVAA
jgi:Putative motility protein